MKSTSSWRPDDPRIEVHGSSDVNMTDIGKFEVASMVEDGIVLTVDDDIWYPPNYVEDMVAAVQRYTGAKPSLASTVVSFRLVQPFPRGTNTERTGAPPLVPAEQFPQIFQSTSSGPVPWPTMHVTFVSITARMRLDGWLTSTWPLKPNRKATR